MTGLASPICQRAEAEILRADSVPETRAIMKMSCAWILFLRGEEAAILLFGED